MRQALKQISEWWQAGCRDLRVAVNVSGAQFEAPGFPDWVFAHLDEAGLPGSCLELEITESLLMADEAAAHSRFARCESSAYTWRSTTSARAIRHSPT
jgi:EAL domain-containing protein (putative c-di-GMP-specific phosphodiesterase class I)